MANHTFGTPAWTGWSLRPGTRRAAMRPGIAGMPGSVYPPKADADTAAGGRDRCSWCTDAGGEVTDRYTLQTSGNVIEPGGQAPLGD